MPTSREIAAKFRARLLKNKTPQERAMKAMLKALGIKFKMQYVIPMPPSFLIADFYIPPPYNIVIEVDGWQHHTPEMAEKDRNRDMYLIRNYGIKTLRLDNIVVNNRSYTMKILKTFLDKQRFNQRKLT